MLLNCNKICNNCFDKGFLWACFLQVKLWISNSEQHKYSSRWENPIAKNNKETTSVVAADNYKLIFIQYIGNRSMSLGFFFPVDLYLKIVICKRANSSSKFNSPTSFKVSVTEDFKSSSCRVLFWHHDFFRKAWIENPSKNF